MNTSPINTKVVVFSMNDDGITAAAVGDVSDNESTTTKITHHEPSLQQIESTNIQLDKAIKQRDIEYQIQVDKLNCAEKAIKERFHLLAAKKASIIEEYGDKFSNEADLIDINAGGKVITAKRSTLTQLKDTKLEGTYYNYV